ncbi:MAG TPA: EfeM/EfeO family lipoprotein [Candidatus Corynebacterium gallistercoris]|uniref:EfeM/EfeO family lipoprotein n=1 Tax=Candidatus Corynebacterium gallistercoris TaxID=2838530 RepID=A0A9D1UQP8_9CORY|nr:EfeM/EfeO family lipoprotein [Candidatus Corynebacterium gallistercoris]
MTLKKFAAAIIPTIMVPSALVACADKADVNSSAAIQVTATDEKCELSSTELSTGTNSFEVTNEGSKINEFYVMTAAGRVEGEVENIGPGASRTLMVELRDAGDYEALCKPGMVGEGISQTLQVTGDSVSSVEGDEALAEAVDNYISYVRAQADNLHDQSEKFIAAIEGGNVEEAKALFPVVRTPYERIEPVAEAFPNDLDPRLDLREADLADSDEWTGFHRIEKDLWVDGKITEDTKAMAKQLGEDLDELVEGVNSDEFSVTPVQIATGAQGLLDEIATGKITGEEDIFSHTDLYDFQANLEGSRAAIAALETPLEERSPGTLDEINERFDQVQELLNKYREGDGFISYDKVTEPQRKELSAALDHLTEAVAQVQGIIAK